MEATENMGITAERDSTPGKRFKMGWFCKSSKYSAGRVLGQILVFIGWLMLVFGIALLGSSLLSEGTVFVEDADIFSRTGSSAIALASMALFVIPAALSVLVPSYIMLGVLDLAAKANSKEG